MLWRGHTDLLLRLKDIIYIRSSMGETHARGGAHRPTVNTNVHVETV